MLMKSLCLLAVCFAQPAESLYVALDATQSKAPELEKLDDLITTSLSGFMAVEASPQEGRKKAARLSRASKKAAPASKKATPAAPDDFRTKCLNTARSLAVANGGSKQKVDRELVIACSKYQYAPRTRACNQFRETLNGHMHKKVSSNLQQMDYNSFCDHFYLVLEGKADIEIKKDEKEEKKEKKEEKKEKKGKNEGKEDKEAKPVQFSVGAQKLQHFGCVSACKPSPVESKCVTACEADWYQCGDGHTQTDIDCQAAVLAKFEKTKGIEPEGPSPGPAPAASPASASAVQLSAEAEKHQHWGCLSACKPSPVESKCVTKCEADWYQCNDEDCQAAVVAKFEKTKGIEPAGPSPGPAPAASPASASASA